MKIRVKGPSLPNSEMFNSVISGGLWSDDQVLFVDLEISGWVLPGLVDVHTHPGAKNPGDVLDPVLLQTQMASAIQGGILAIRSPGLASNPPDWFGTDPQLPRAFHTGPWLAKPGQFINGWGKRVSDAEFPAVAAAQAIASGWCKIIADWGRNDEPVSFEILQAIVAAVHAVGGRVAVHSQNLGGGASAVKAGVDSLEHGMWLDESFLSQMKSKGTALVPTLSVFQNSLEMAKAKMSPQSRDWYIGGTERHPELIRTAFEAGVTVLAGTDSAAISIGDEVRSLAKAGIPIEAAIGSASWTARKYLGLASLEIGSSADAIIYAEDPRRNPDILDHPEWVISRGHLIRRPS
jgi:imidazolonepropionase-like amidohydrolase